jgi:Domain of unknown function (DUF4349)
MKRRTRIAIIIAAAGLAVLFLLRLASTLSDRGSPAAQYFDKGGLSNEPSAPVRKANYATERILVPQGPAQQVLDQKYERVADIRSSSSDFDADSKRIRAIAAAASAIVQRENANGLPGSRVLALSLGVVPAAFDSTVESLRAVGKIKSITSSKTDRTADFMALEAKRSSLEKTRDGLKALRRTGAALSDLVALESKILEIEGQVQELGVSLGDFSENNSFCTIDVSLEEAAPRGAGRILAAALDSLGWAVLVELGLAATGLAAAAVAALGAWAYRRFKQAAGGSSD